MFTQLGGFVTKAFGIPNGTRHRIVKGIQQQLSWSLSTVMQTPFETS